MTIDIAERKAAAEAKLAQVRWARGVALADGLDFDSSIIEAAEAELEGLIDAEGELVRRDRDGIAKAEAERLAGLRAKLAVTEEHRLEAIERAENAAHDLTAALQEALTRSAEVTRMLRALNVYPALNTDRLEAERRLSMRLVSAFKPLSGLRRKFGAITFPEAQTRYSIPWRMAEQLEAAKDITRAIGAPLNGVL